jgi:hypothetical protein
VFVPTAVKIDAMTLMGEMLKAAEKNQGAVPGKTGSKGKPVLDTTPTLADLGIGKKESSDAQALADMKQSDPETHEEVRSGKTSIPPAFRLARGPGHAARARDLTPGLTGHAGRVRVPVARQGPIPARGWRERRRNDRPPAWG